MKLTVIPKVFNGAISVAHLAERSLPMPEVHGSNSVIGKLLYWTFICLLSTVLKRQIKKKRPGMANLKDNLS